MLTRKILGRCSRVAVVHEALSLTRRVGDASGVCLLSACVDDMLSTLDTTACGLNADAAEMAAETVTGTHVMMSRTVQMKATSVSLSPTRFEDFEELVSLRIEAMRASLERIGRFDAVRARERFRSSFVSEFTRHILAEGERVGFVTVRPTPDGLSLDHLYVRTEFQGRGIGSAILATLFEEADSKALPLRVGALRGSDSNRFYLRHGFIRVEETEWDIYYIRSAARRC